MRVELGVDGPSMVHIEADRALAESEVETALAEEGVYTIVR